MAHGRWAVLAPAIAAAGCGPMACELFVGNFELDYCLEGVVTPWEQLGWEDYTCHDFETCLGLGYTLPCPMGDGSTYWKRPQAHCPRSRKRRPGWRAGSRR